MNNLKPGIIFLYNGQPHEVLEANHLKVAQRRPVMQTKFKNLITGVVLYENFQQSDSFEEAEVSRESCRFIYANRGQYWFHKIGKPSERFFLEEKLVGNRKLFLKPNSDLDISFFKEKAIEINLPVKMDFKVIEAPPSIKGDTAQGGNKEVTIETGAKIKTPLFIEEEDIIRVNTNTGEYAERVTKA